MTKKDKLSIGILLVVTLTLPIISYPKLIASNPTEFPTLNRLQALEANLKSSKSNSSTETINAIPKTELEDLLKSASSETVKAGLILSSPFGALAVKINERAP